MGKSKQQEQQPKESRVKKLVHSILNRRYVFEGKSIHPGDETNVLRCLDITLIDFLNGEAGFKLHRINGWKLTLLMLQIAFVFFCIGVPSLLKIKWEQKKYFVGLAVIMWYVIMWYRWLRYEWPERHILQNKKGIKIMSRFDRKRMIYHPTITMYGQEVNISMRLKEDGIFNADGDFNKQAFTDKCAPILEVLGKKSQ